MRNEDIPNYIDPDSFDDVDAKYPCNTQYMRYDPLLHRYHLTAEGLEYYGIDTSEIEDIDRFIKKVSKKIYDYIQYRSGWKRYQIQMYRIATAPETIYPSRYAMRKQFEECLAEQARWLIECGDSAMVSSFDIENRGKPTTSPDNEYRDTSDIAKESIRTLETLGLTRWFNVPQFMFLDKNKY